MSGAPLDPQLVKEARAVEMRYFEDMRVYTRVPRSHQKETGGKAIRVKWVDINLGDSERPLYRSRLVGQVRAEGAS